MWSKLILAWLKTGHDYSLGFLEYCHEIAKRDGVVGYTLIPNEIWEKAVATWPYDVII